MNNTEKIGKSMMYAERVLLLVLGVCIALAFMGIHVNVLMIVLLSGLSLIYLTWGFIWAPLEIEVKNSLLRHTITSSPNAYWLSMFLFALASISYFFASDSFGILLGISAAGAT
jgi:hypothetical protein